MKTALCVLFLSLAALGQTVSFTAPKNYYGGVGCAYAIVGDWNGDGKMDIGCVSQGYLTTHLGNGDGTFQHYVHTKWPYQSSPPPITFGISTTHQTGLAVVNNTAVNSYGLDIWLPTSTGSFYYKETLIPNGCPQAPCNNIGASGASNVVSGDFNGDGNTDLAFGLQGTYCDDVGLECTSWGETDYFPGNGDGTFGYPQALASDGGRSPGSLLGVSPQLMVINNNAANTLMAYSSDMWKTECTCGNCNCFSPFPIPGDAMATVNGELNWKFLPIPSSLDTGNVLFGKFGKSISSFLVPAYNYNSGTTTTQLMVFSNVFGNRSRRSTTVPGFFNPTSANYFDSHLDVAGTYRDPDGNTGVAIFFGNGDGTFNSTPLVIPDRPGYTSTNVQVADFNGDNKPDIVAAMYTTTHPGEVEVVLNSTNPKTPTVSVASSSNPSTQGESVTFTATVEPQPLNWSTESVIFYSGTTRLAKVQLVNGTASVSTTKLPVGTHAITAAYSGDCCDYLPNSASLTQVVVK